MAISLDLSEKFKRLIRREEGLSLKIYKDSRNIYTVGYGRNLESKGLTNQEAEYLLDNDTNEVYGWLSRNYFWFADLDVIRQTAIMAMRFQLGESGFQAFTKMLSAMRDKDYMSAAVAMGDSKWAKQTPERVKQLQTMVSTGNMP